MSRIKLGFHLSLEFVCLVFPASRVGMKACENECREFVAPVQQALYSAPSSSTQTLLLPPAAAGEPSPAAGRGVAEQLCRQGWGAAQRTGDSRTGTWHSPASCPLGFPLLPGKLILTGKNSVFLMSEELHSSSYCWATPRLPETQRSKWQNQCSRADRLCYSPSTSRASHARDIDAPEARGRHLGSAMHISALRGERECPCPA